MSVAPGPGSPPVPSVCLVTLDGWGLAPPGPGNAVAPPGGHSGPRLHERLSGRGDHVAVLINSDLHRNIA